RSTPGARCAHRCLPGPCGSGGVGPPPAGGTGAREAAAGARPLPCTSLGGDERRALCRAAWPGGARRTLLAPAPALAGRHGDTAPSQRRVAPAKPRADVPPLARGRLRAAPDRRHRGTVHVPHGPAASTTSPLPAATGSERDRVPDGTRGAGGGRAMGSVPHARARAAAPARAAAD